MLCLLLSVASSHARVTHIMFDHKKEGGDKGTDDALAIRLNFNDPLKHECNGKGEGEFVRELFETNLLGAGFIRFVGQPPARVNRDEPALYSIKRTNATTPITIKIRIVLLSDPGVNGRWFSAKQSTNSTLPEIEEKLVQFKKVEGNQVWISYDSSKPAGKEQEYVEFKLKAFFQPGQEKIAKLTGSWEWSYSTVSGGGGSRSNLVASAHILYVVLDVPKEPWYKSETTRPWVSALDFAFDKIAGVKGSTDVKMAGEKIVPFIHKSFGLRYGTKGEPAANFLKGEFNLTGFIKGTSGKVVTCVDTAASVQIFMSLLGGSAEIRHVKPGGAINRTDLIGVGVTNNPSYEKPGSNNQQLLDDNSRERSTFDFHTYVLYDLRIYDACVGPYIGADNEEEYRKKVFDRSEAFERNITISLPPDSRSNTLLVKNLK